ncbi:MAG TPA: HEAT repeat domain-containing protein [Gaiellaceae bacterium]
MTSPSDERIEERLRELDTPRWRERKQVWADLKHLGNRAVPYLAEYYPHAKKWQARATLVVWATPYARTSEDAFQLGLRACRDRARLVRHRACELLAYSLRKDALPTLRGLLDHPDPTTRDDAQAAIDAIVNRNHNLVRDRDHSGRVFWVVWPEDLPPGAPRMADPRPR